MLPIKCKDARVAGGVLSRFQFIYTVCKVFTPRRRLSCGSFSCEKQ